MDALARHPALVAVELVTLLAAGTGLWLELVSSPPMAPRLPNPHRAAIAALAMWSTWAVGYALGLANHAVFHGYDGPGSALSAVADAPFLTTAGRIEALYLATLSRAPRPEELNRLVRYVEAGGAGGRALADVFWALLNGIEFRTNH